jgi:hypothetical protein
VLLGELAGVPTRSFMQPGAFEPELIAAMTEVFAAACKALDDAGLSEGVREQIARQIITAAKFGERDRGRLRAAALAGLSSKID